MIQPIQPTRTSGSPSAHARLFGTGELKPAVRCAVIVAHPVDEIVGAGCLISKLTDVTILHVTNGATLDREEARAAGFNDVDDYARAMREECISALAIAKVSPKRVVELAVTNHRASECLPELAKSITTFLQQSGADIVLTHPYEGGHPDHDATAFAAHAALRLLKQNGVRPPTLFEMALHPAEDGIAKVADFLPASDGEITTLLLDERARKLKRQMFDCFKSQRESLEVSGVGPEKFRQPESYDFSVPPQPGKLHYENFDWALTSHEWQARARQALRELSLYPNTQVAR
jgi:LmbE family N-acetylglucosaminyl deacetylase